jgi:uncharacterized protein
VLREIFILPVRVYQKLVSPLLPPSCKYHPSCSQYAIDALRTFGPAKGSVLAAWRLVRCNPFSHGGYDPVENQRLFRRQTSDEKGATA